MSKMQYIQCIYCKYPMEIDLDFAIKNGRVFCGTCCKAFEVDFEKKKIKEDEDEIPDIPYFPDDGW